MCWSNSGLLWFFFTSCVWLVKKTGATLSTNQTQDFKQLIVTGHSCFPVLQVMRFFIPQLSWQYWDIFPFFVICSCDYSDFGLTSLIKKHSYCNLRYLYKLWETRGRSEYQWNPTDTVYSFVREVEGKNNVSSFSSPKLQLITKECIKGVSF